MIPTRVTHFAGQKFAMLEEKVVLSSLFRNYELKSSQTTEDLGIFFELVIRHENGVRVTLDPRVWTWDLRENISSLSIHYIFKKINSSSFENFSFINDWFMYFLFVMIHSSQNWMVVATNLCELQLSNSERSHLISSFSFFSLHRLSNYLPTRKSIHPNIDESRWTMINEIKRKETRKETTHPKNNHSTLQ